jgi:hypothetical protein
VDRKFKMATIVGDRLHIIFMGNAFSPSSFWEPLYIIHSNLGNDHLTWREGGGMVFF